MNTATWTDKLIELIKECRAENSDQRLGQLLYNAMAAADKKAGKKKFFIDDTDYDGDFHGRLFYIEDTELVKILRENANV